MSKQNALAISLFVGILVLFSVFWFNFQKSQKMILQSQARTSESFYKLDLSLSRVLESVDKLDKDLKKYHKY